MNPRKLVAATTLAFAAFTGIAQADLASDLRTMSAADALARAVQSESTSIEALVASAAEQLQGQPELLMSLITAAIDAFPGQAAQIVSAAITQAPTLAGDIVSAALSATEDNPAVQTAINQAATDTIAKLEQTAAGPTEAPADQAPPPPPPPTNSPARDKPVPVSPN